MGDSNNENTGQYNKIAELHGSASKILGETLDIERDVFETLGNLNYTESSKDNIIKIKNKVNDLKEVRINLMNRLANLHNNAIDNTVFAKDTLVNNKSMYDLIEKQLEHTNSELKKVKEEINNKRRMVQIGDYEFSRFEEYKKILKMTVYCMIVIAITIFLMGIPVFPDFIGYIVIVVTLAFLVWNLGNRILLNTSRSNMDYHKFVNTDIVKDVGKGTVRNKLDLEDLLRSKCNTKSNDLENTATSISEINTTESFISKTIFNRKNKKEPKKHNITSVANISAYNDNNNYSDF
tara:strand:- start:483 stop:1361 length:879 start_codon:yes stop_codon:yes gene_type:complete